MKYSVIKSILLAVLICCIQKNSIAMNSDSNNVTLALDKSEYAEGEDIPLKIKLINTKENTVIYYKIEIISALKIVDEENNQYRHKEYIKTLSRKVIVGTDTTYITSDFIIFKDSIHSKSTKIIETTLNKDFSLEYNILPIDYHYNVSLPPGNYYLKFDSSDVTYWPFNKISTELKFKISPKN